MARKLRVGFVGLGRVFDLNVRGYLDHPEAGVSALCDADPVVLARRAAEHPGAHATPDFQDLIHLDLDLIEILTPHPQHEAMTVAALSSGSHVSLQKPMAMTLPECDRMIKAAAASGRRLKAPRGEPSALRCVISAPPKSTCANSRSQSGVAWGD